MDGALYRLAPSSVDWYNGTTGRTPVERLSFVYQKISCIFCQSERWAAMQPGQSGQSAHGPRSDQADVESVQTTGAGSPAIAPPAIRLPQTGSATGKAVQAGDPTRSQPVGRGHTSKVPGIAGGASSGGYLSDPGPDPVGSRTPSLTQRIRSLQPPDVARQALSELGVLAHELSNLPIIFESAGLARTHQSTYLETVNAYLGLAHQAWEAVGEERLEQSGAEPGYRQRAISVARRITRLQQETRAVSTNSEFTLPRRIPVYWRRRTLLLRDGLQIWQDRLASPPSVTDMGHGLFLLRGYAGLAAAGSIFLGLLDFLIGATLATLSLLGVGLVALLAASGISGSISDITRFSIGVLATILIWIFVMLLAVSGPLPIGLVLGASVFSPSRTTRNSGSGRLATAGFLRIWWLVVGVVSIPALLGALVLGSLLVRTVETIAAPTSLYQALVVGGSALALGVSAAVIVCLALLLLLVLPVLVVTGLRGAAEMAASPAVIPAARHYAVQPALVVDTILTVLLVIATWTLATSLGLGNIQLITLPVGGSGNIGAISISLRSVVLLIALILPYVLLLDQPYRRGVRNWQRLWLGDLTARRADVESHIRRLSVTDPRTGVQDTSEENLRAMQYDLVLLQFYQSKIEEAQKVRYSPVPEKSQYLGFLVLVIAALILDSGASVLAHVLPLVGS
jgi:hypothetical protein